MAHKHRRKNGIVFACDCDDGERLAEAERARDSAFETWKKLHQTTLAAFIKNEHDPIKARLAEAVAHLKKDWEFFAFDMGPGCEDAVRVEDFLTSIGHSRPADSASAGPTCPNCGARTKIPTGSHCPRCYPGTTETADAGQTDEKGRPMTYWGGKSESASACRFCGQPKADHLNPGDCENPNLKSCHLKPRDGTPMGDASTVDAAQEGK